MDDINRLRQEYSRRRNHDKGHYSWLSRSYVQAMQSRERQILINLPRFLKTELSQSTLLEIGCGSGGVLVDFNKWGIPASQIVGIDLLQDRLQEAKKRFPFSWFSEANGERLPFPDHRFSMVIQFTAFSSILDRSIRERMAQEMLRVLTSDGVIIWYDFWVNPTNPQTHGITKKEIKQLLGDDCTYEFHKITLAPPLARRLVPVSRIAAEIIESARFLNTHWLVFIRKK